VNFPWDLKGADSLSSSSHCCFYDTSFCSFIDELFFFSLSLEAFRMFFISSNYICKSRQKTPNIDLFHPEHKVIPFIVRKVSRPNRMEAFDLR
jgi:hypothetical protein